MDIVLYMIATWAVVGAFQWASWAFPLGAELPYDIYGNDDIYDKIETSWQWFWAGPFVWLLRLLCYLMQKKELTT